MPGRAVRQVGRFEKAPLLRRNATRSLPVGREAAGVALKKLKGECPLPLRLSLLPTYPHTANLTVNLTGQRRLIEYLLSPVVQAVSEAGRER